MSKKFVFAFITAVLAIGLAGCDGDKLTAPDGTVYLEIVNDGITVRAVTAQGYYKPFGDGAGVLPDDTLEVRVKFHGRGEVEIEDPVKASVFFLFEDGTLYEMEGLVYGPFTGKKFEVPSTFRLQDGLVQQAFNRRGQIISYFLKFNNGQEFRIFGFYILQ